MVTKIHSKSLTKSSTGSNSKGSSAKQSHKLNKQHSGSSGNSSNGSSPAKSGNSKHSVNATAAKLGVTATTGKLGVSTTAAKLGANTTVGKLEVNATTAKLAVSAKLGVNSATATKLSVSAAATKLSINTAAAKLGLTAAAAAKLGVSAPTGAKLSVSAATAATLGVNGGAQFTLTTKGLAIARTSGSTIVVATGSTSSSTTGASLLQQCPGTGKARLHLVAPLPKVKLSINLSQPACPRTSSGSVTNTTGTVTTTQTPTNTTVVTSSASSRASLTSVRCNSSLGKTNGKPTTTTTGATATSVSVSATIAATTAAAAQSSRLIRARLSSVLWKRSKLNSQVASVVPPQLVATTPQPNPTTIPAQHPAPSTTPGVVLPATTALLVSAPSASPGKTSPSSGLAPWSPVHNGGTAATQKGLDSDTINYIHRIYCRECRMEEVSRRSDTATPTSSSTSTASVHDLTAALAAPAHHGLLPPLSLLDHVEDGSLANAMDKNKESLKRRLLLRRSVNELVDQGIYPPLKTPPQHAEQRKQLERAKNADLLKHKIQQRPDRQALVQQHILEDSTAAPSLQVRQRQLKRARLQDSLSDRLANRPGPLELVEGNILQTDPQLQDAIRGGKLLFQKTSEVTADRRSKAYNFEDDSNSSDGAPSPQTLVGLSGSDSDVAMAAATINSNIPSPPDITPLLQASGMGGKTYTFSSHTSTMPTITTQSFSPSSPHSATSAGSLSSGGGSSHRASSNNGSNSSGGGKAARLKKPKPKSTPKSKIIKFHEYKGPPNAVKSALNASATSPDGTPYHVMLQQQQLFLQWQLEFQQKNVFMLPAQQKAAAAAAAASAAAGSDPNCPSMALSPASTPMQGGVPSPAGSDQSSNTSMPRVFSPPPPVVTSPPPTTGILSSIKPKTLEEYKVADLKAECKKRNLIVSGPKPALLERLKPYAEAILNNLNNPNSSASSSPQPHTVSVSSLTSPGSNSSWSNFGDMQGMSPQSMQALGNIINIQPLTPQSVQPSEDSMTCGTPPVSPSCSSVDLNASQNSVGPISPDLNMDINIASPPSIISLASQVVPKSLVLSSSSGSLPMLVDSQNMSRPSSVAPMDVDLSGSHPNITLLQQQQQQQQQKTSIVSAGSMEVIKAALNAANAAPLKILSPPLQSQTPSPIAATALPIEPTTTQQVQPQMVTSTAASTGGATQFISVQMPQPVQMQVAQPQIISQEELVRQQQKQIDDLRRQLLMSQQQLFEAKEVANNKFHLLANQTLLGQIDIKPQLTQLQQQQQAQQALQQQQHALQQVQQQAQQLQQQQSLQQQQQQQQPMVAQILQAVRPQTQAAIPSIAISCSGLSNSTDSKASLSNLLQSQKVGFTTTTVGGQTKVLSFTTASAMPANAAQPQFIFTTQPDQNANTVGKAPRQQQTVTLPVNGLNNNRASSVPTSPIGHNNLHRSATNPLFNNLPSKDPPNYDEVVKNKQNLLGGAEQHLPNGTPTSMGSVPKNQTMDDVLEILIRSGELPASAVQESPLTPKVETVSSRASLVSKPLIMAAAPLSSKSVPLPTSSQVVFTMPSSFTSTAGMATTTSVLTPIPSVPNNISPGLPAQLSMNQLGKERMPPLSLLSGAPTNMSIDLAPPVNISDLPNSLADLPFITMDWSDSDNTIPNLDLPDMLDTPNPLRTCLNMGSPSGSASSRDGQDLLSVPPGSGSNAGGSVHGSEPNLSQLGFGDELQDQSTMNLDVSDWLDVIMPSSGLTPLSATAPMSFPSDPILTPKPQDVLELFNIEESDLYTPSDLGPSTFDKVVETATSKS